MNIDRLKKAYEDVIPFLGKITDKEVNKKFGFKKPIAHILRKRLGMPRRNIKDKYADIIPLLGLLSDAIIAKKINVHPHTIFNLRKRLKINGIKQTNPHWAAKQVLSRRKCDYCDIMPLLGNMPDNQIAIKFGLSRERIRQIRHMYGVNKFKNNIKKEIKND